MNAAGPLLFLAIAISVLFGFIYLSFFIVGRTQCSQQEILRCSAALTGLALILGIVGSLLNTTLPMWSTKVLSNVAFLILHYQFGRRMLKLSWKRALLAVCINIGLFLILLAALIGMLYAGGFPG